MRINLISVFYLLACCPCNLMGILPQINHAFIANAQQENVYNQDLANPNDLIALESWLNNVQESLYHSNPTFSAAVLDAIEITFTAFFSNQDHEQLLSKLAALINSTSVTPKGIITDLLTHIAIPITEITTVHAMLTVMLSISNHPSSGELTEAHLNAMCEAITATLKTKCSSLSPATIDEQSSPLGTVFLWALLLSVAGFIGYLLYQHLQEKNTIIQTQTEDLAGMQHQLETMQTMQTRSQARIRELQNTMQQINAQIAREAQARQRNTGRIIRTIGASVLGPIILDNQGRNIGTMDLYSSYNIDLSSRRMVFEPRFREDLQRLRNP